MNHDRYDDAYIGGILNSVKTVAMVGASANDVRPSFFVMKYLLNTGFEVFPVNPGQAGQSALGEVVRGSLAEIGEPVDMVDIFRRSEEAGGVVDEALAVLPGVKTMWMQLGVVDEAAAARARRPGCRAA